MLKPGNKNPTEGELLFSGLFPEDRTLGINGCDSEKSVYHGLCCLPTLLTTPVVSFTFLRVLHYFLPSLSFTVALKIASTLSPHLPWSCASKNTNWIMPVLARKPIRISVWFQAAYSLFEKGAQRPVTSAAGPSLSFCLFTTSLGLGAKCVSSGPFQGTTLSFDHFIFFLVPTSFLGSERNPDKSV